MTFDAIVVGAGAAGLAAARSLSESGASAVVLEARDRIGGRVYTRRDPGCAAPIELGAEFIHGTPDVTLHLLQESGSTAIGEGGSSWEYDGTRLERSGDEFDDVDELMQHVDRSGRDETVEAFLQRFALVPELAELCRWTRMLVEGFDAADPHDASIQAIAEEWSGDASLQTTQLRPSEGYTMLLDSLCAALPSDRVRVQLQSTVREIAWSSSGVRVTYERFKRIETLEARRAIVTVPIGVLKSGAIRFDPELPQHVRNAIDSIAMGPVVKIGLRFAAPFWPSDAGFFIGGEHTSFPVFWTTYPIVSPVVVGWAGGPRCARFGSMSEPEILAQSIGDLSRMFAISADSLYAQLTACYMHDWVRDPYALGAYSYVKSGGMGARATLAEPLSGALFLAGEATAEGGEAGTVAGAIQSGIAAARLAMKRQ